MSKVLLLEVSVVLLAVGALVSAALARRRRLSGWVSTVFVAMSAAAIWVVVVGTFASGGKPERTLLELPTLGASLTIAVDPLSAFFLAVFATMAVLSTLYSVDYMTHYKSDSVARFYPVLLVFFISLIGVLVTFDFLFFLVSWELMTLSSFFIVMFERKSAASQRAGLKYFIITHAATLCMVAAGLILWQSAGSFHFAAMRDALVSLLATQPFVGHLVIFLFFMGFATKAGVLPMGDWLPDAHPVAPSGMSAMLSGVLVKIGIYGMIRVFCFFLPVSSVMESWGIVLALAGTASLFVGNLTGLRQTDSKRLMAFSTIGQIGYICLGLGVGLYCLPSRPELATLALMGALFHTANHACFKSCLFMGAGSVLYRTGERNMNKLGGLGESMPITAGSSVVASLSISGVPPFNGFASKWLILVTCLLAGLQSPLFLALGIVGLFISLATLGMYIQFLGAVFLGNPHEVRKSEEVPASMAVPQLVLAVLCILLGVFPLVPLIFIHEAVAGVAQVALPPLESLMSGSWSGMALSVEAATVGVWIPPILVVGVGLLALLAYTIQRAGAAKVREVPVWTCGEEHEAATVRYPAGSFYLPFKHAFRGIYPRLKVRAPGFPARLRRVFEIDRWLFNPIVRLVNVSARQVSKTHLGTPQLYLLWIVVGAIAVVGIMFAVVT